MATSRKSAEACPVCPNYACGVIAGLVNVSTTFPINKIIFRQQIGSVRFHVAVLQLYKEGFLMLYRGMALPLCQKSVQIGLMYGCFQTYYRMLPSDLSDRTRTLYAATLTGISEAFIATPFERGQSLLQTPAFHGKIKNTFDLRHHIKSTTQWYRGLSAILIRNCSTNCLFFSLRKPLRDSLPTPHSRRGHVLADFVSGACLGGINSTLIYPVNVVKSHQQKQLAGQGESLAVSLRKVLKERGNQYRKLYYGVQLNFTRAIISWGIINSTFEMCMYFYRQASVEGF